MPTFDYYPKPISEPGLHEVVIRDHDTQRVIEVGQGDDDSAALLNLVTILTEGGAPREQIRSVAHQSRIAHKFQKGTEPPFDNAPQCCPRCGVAAEEHEPGECLDAWVHGHFMDEEVPPDRALPRYSDNSESAVEIVVRHEAWPVD